jgi:uncharacterized phage-like protein YoqJ
VILLNDKNDNLSCSFTGPRPKNFPWQSEDILYIKPLCDRLENEIRIAIKKGYRHFISGMAIGVDIYAARIVLKIKDEQPNTGITLEAVVPFPSQPNKWLESQQVMYKAILKRADKITVIGQEPTTGNFNKRNDYMVDNADLVIAVKPDKSGGTQRSIDYAIRMNKEVIIIDPYEYMMDS